MFYCYRSGIHSNSFWHAQLFVFPAGPWQNRRARLAQDGGQPDPLLLGSRPLRGVGHCAPPAPHHLYQHCAGRHSSWEEGQYRCGTLTIWWMLNVDKMADMNGDEIIFFQKGGL